MKKISKLLPFIFGFLLFKEWFINSQIIGGDWPFFYDEFLREFSLFPPSWASYQGNGLGGQFVSYSLDTYLYIIVSVFFNNLGFSWEFIYKIFFFGMFIVLSISSSRYLLNVVSQRLGGSELLSFICSLIYLANTYALMTVGGGQMGVALAYSFAPFVIGRFIKLLNDNSFYLLSSISTGLVLALQAIFDLRIAYITFMVVMIFILFEIKVILSMKDALYKIRVVLFKVGTTLIVLLFGHLFWILPSLLSWSNLAYDLIINTNSEGIFTFLSFAEFSHTLSLLHPNWPENIFGKVHFMKPEFIFLPIMAFSSLLFLNKIATKNKKELRIILLFSIIALFGAFMSKGANPPLGEINIWLYSNMPGFVVFRDSSKFSLLMIIAYSILIPYFIIEFSCFTANLFKGNKRLFFYLFCTAAIFYLFFLIRQLPLNQLGGTFSKHQIPSEYTLLKKFLHHQPEFFRTLWIPRQHRFSYYSNLHPAVEANILFGATNSAEIIDKLKMNDTHKKLSNLSIKYLIVPYDPLGEIFIDEKKYDGKEYKFLIKEIEKIGNYKKINGYKKIAVFAIQDPNDHIWIDEGQLSYEKKRQDYYRLSVSSKKDTIVFFSEQYNPQWIMRVNNKIIHSQKTQDGLNSFLFPASDNVNAEISFQQTSYYYYGYIISFSFFTCVVCIYIYLYIRRLKHEK